MFTANKNFYLFVLLIIFVLFPGQFFYFQKKIENVEQLVQEKFFDQVSQNKEQSTSIGFVHFIYIDGFGPITTEKVKVDTGRWRMRVLVFAPAKEVISIPVEVYREGNDKVIKHIEAVSSDDAQQNIITVEEAGTYFFKVNATEGRAWAIEIQVPQETQR